MPVLTSAFNTIVRICVQYRKVLSELLILLGDIVALVDGSKLRGIIPEGSGMEIVLVGLQAVSDVIESHDLGI